ncbi:hypothetical protein [Williamsia sp.]|uniref:hypothetical protein n=1 Tax=Williamsia sp. TaxID=1872085 RepID=UPI002F91E533
MAVAVGVADGTVSLAFRRWKASRVKAGEVFQSYSGLVRITAVDEVDPDAITDDQAGLAGEKSVAALRKRFRGNETDPVFRIALTWAGPDPRIALRTDDHLSPEDVVEIVTRLDRFDARSPSGPWTRETLGLIEGNPGRRAIELADMCGREKDPFKLDVRKLKNLGLTHSLAVGYELSARGRAFLVAERGQD